MKKLQKPQIPNDIFEKRVFKLKSAILNGYEYTKTYYHMEDGTPVKSETGSDHDITVINICKSGASTDKRKSFIFSDGYIGAERSYHEDGTKKKSVARKNCFGMEYLIKYIENSEHSDFDFHAVFLSDKEKSEDQAELIAQIIQDLTTEKTEQTYIWSHSKSGLMTLRALQKMREQGTHEPILQKIKAVITSMPTKGLDAVNRPKMINTLNSNKFVNFLPFSGFIKTAILKFYDSSLYKPTPAQVDLKPPSEIENNFLQNQPSGFKKILNKIWGNEAFAKQVQNEKKVNYDAEYLGRVTSDENMKTISDLNYRTLPVDINLRDSFEALIKHAQIMPFILYSKKIFTTKDKGDGIITMDNQGINEDKKYKFKHNLVVHATHDVPTTPEALETIGEQLLEDDQSELEKMLSKKEKNMEDDETIK